MTMTETETRTEIDRLLDAGDESALNTFFVRNFKVLPERMQRKTLFAFFADAVEKQAGEAFVAKLQQDGLDAVEKLEEIKARLAGNTR